MTPPNTYNCTRCRAPLAPGSTQCANCGMTFDTPVPAAPPAAMYGSTPVYGAAPLYGSTPPYGSVPGYGPPPGYGGAPAKSSSPIAIVAIVCAVGCLPMIAIFAAILFPVFAKARLNVRERRSTSNVQQLSMASQEFADDHDQQLPPLDTMDHFKASVFMYLPAKSKYDLFVQPGPNAPYKLNSAMSGKSIKNVANPSSIAIVEETVPRRDGRFAIGYADGRVGLGRSRKF